MDEVAEILQEFIQETREHLSAIEPDLLEMERQGERVSSEIVNRLFRAIHSTKGGASFLSFQALKEFSHAMENVLMLIRDGQLEATSDVVDALLRGVDVLRAMVDDVENSESIPCHREMETLSAILADVAAHPPVPASTNTEVEAAAASAKAPKPATAVRTVMDAKPKSLSLTPRVETTGPIKNSKDEDRATPPTASGSAAITPEEELARFDVSLATLAKPLSMGMAIHRIAFGSVGDLAAQGQTPASLKKQLAPLGILLSTLLLPAGAPEQQQTFEALLASVLERSLLAGDLGLNESVIATLDIAALRNRLKAGDSARQTKATTTKEVSKTTEGRSEHGSDLKETLRVRVDLLNRLMNVAGELVLGRNQLLRSLKDNETIPGLATILQHIDRVTTELQEGVMQTRMQPIGTLFGRYSRVVRDMARQLGKTITLNTEGEDVELDKSIIEALADPLTHLVRNCVDHAIEPPDERQAAGKAPAGRISLLAFHESGQVNIVVSDDGRGISRSKVIKKAVEKGLVTQSEVSNMSDRDVVKLVLMPGFSTAEKITDISGRGVGMDVVRTNVEKLGGHLEVASEENVGTTVMLRLPLTLAIIPSLIVRAGTARFAVPQVSIVELVWVRADEIQTRIEIIHGAPVLRLRGSLLALVRLVNVLGIPAAAGAAEVAPVRESRPRVGKRATPLASAETRAGPQVLTPQIKERQPGCDYNVLVLRAGPNRFGIIVDELFESEEIVVKPLPSHLKDLDCFAGTTILGDGRVTMILDPGGIAARSHLSFANVSREEERRLAEQERQKRSQDSVSRAVILFNNAPGEVFAVPQDTVLRLERIAQGDILNVGGRDFVKYRGTGLPVVRLDQHYPVKPVPSGAEEMFLVIPKNRRDGVVRGGILVWKILDALDVEVSLDRPLFSGPGLVGSAIIDGNLTMFLDLGQLFDSVEHING